MKHHTMQRTVTPTAILVGLSDELAAPCAEVLGEGGLRVLKVGHVAAASERIPVVMPQLVLLSSTLRADEVETINDRCVAVGARVIMVAARPDLAALISELKNAATAALVKALRGG